MVDFVSLARQESAIFHDIVDTIILLIHDGSEYYSTRLFRLRGLLSDLERIAISVLPEAAIILFHREFRNKFADSVIQYAQRASRDERLRKLSPSQLQKEVWRSMVSVIGKGGRLFRYAPDYFFALLCQSVYSEHEKNTILTEATASGFDLVQVSPQKSVTGDFCDYFRGRVFSISGASDQFPPLTLCPSGGPPFHPWCQHKLIPVREKSIAVDRARKLPQLHNEFIALSTSGGSPSDYQRVFESLRYNS